MQRLLSKTLCRVKAFSAFLRTNRDRFTFRWGMEVMGIGTALAVALCTLVIVPLDAYLPARYTSAGLLGFLVLAVALCLKKFDRLLSESGGLNRMPHVFEITSRGYLPGSHAPLFARKVTAHSSTAQFPKALLEADESVEQ